MPVFLRSVPRARLCANVGEARASPWHPTGLPVLFVKISAGLCGRPPGRGAVLGTEWLHHGCCRGGRRRGGSRRCTTGPFAPRSSGCWCQRSKRNGSGAPHGLQSAPNKDPLRTNLPLDVKLQRIDTGKSHSITRPLASATDQHGRQSRQSHAIAAGPSGVGSGVIRSPALRYTRRESEVKRNLKNSAPAVNVGEATLDATCH